MLKDVKLGSTLNGQVISVVNFGAFIDVGCEKDVLLHVKDMSEEFISHPSTLVSPGDTLSVYVKYSVDGKVGLSLLENSIQKDVDEDVIQVDDLDEGDELWGEVVRSTNFGFFISVGTSQPAFLHFMDHSDFPLMEGTHPKDYGMEGEKVRVWVKEVDGEKGRVKVGRRGLCFDGYGLWQCGVWDCFLPKHLEIDFPLRTLLRTLLRF